MPGRRGFRLATVFGIPIRIDPTWFLVITLLSWTLSTVYFPGKYPAFSVRLQWTLGVSAALLLFVCVLVHELGHALEARRSRIAVEGLTLFMFGGVSELRDEPPSAAAEARMTLAGWLLSAVLAALSFGVYVVLPTDSTGWLATRALFKYLTLVNGLLFTFNGIPGFPLDGGRLLRAFIWWATGNLRRATQVASRVGSFFGVGLIGLGLLSIFKGAFIPGIWVGLIGLFLRNGAQAGYRQMLLRRALQGVPVSRLMTRNVVTVSSPVTLQALVSDYFMRHHFHSFPVVDDGLLKGIVSLHDVKEVTPSALASFTVGDLLAHREDAGPWGISPGMDAMDVLAEMARTGRGRLPVIVGGELVGIVTRRDITQFLAIRTDLLPEG